MYRAILFDLDGTITASAEGITKSIQYALEKCGYPQPDLQELEVFIGPPLLEQFMSYCGFSREEAQKAVEYYRERYQEEGIFECRPYPGVEEMLRALKRQGYLLAVASSKPEAYVIRILEHFGLRSYFHQVAGANLDGTRTGKGEVVAEALRLLKMEGHEKEVILVGDKEHDVYGAREQGVDCLAVTYGYGTEEELQKAGPRFTADSPGEVQDFFCIARDGGGPRENSFGGSSIPI